VLGEVQQANKPMFRAFLLTEELRLLYQLDDPALAPAHLDAWLAWRHPDHASSRSSSSPGRSAATATASSPQSASA
jgi:transposase